MPPQTSQLQDGPIGRPAGNVCRELPHGPASGLQPHMAWNQGAIRLAKSRATASENRRELSEEEAVQEQKIQRIILSYCIRFLCKSEYQVHVAQQLQNLCCGELL